jgi:hypothetical protein
VVRQCSVKQVDRAMGMDFILNIDGKNEGGIANIERNILAQWKGKDDILSRVTCLERKRLYRDLLVCKRKHWLEKNLVV